MMVRRACESHGINASGAVANALDEAVSHEREMKDR